VIKIAPEGYIYTNGTDFGKKIHLASGSNGDEWYTITIEEYEKIMAERSKADELLSNNR
jgi:hypothetical protein